MPKKIRELKDLLKKAGFIDETAKGSPTKWSHLLLFGKVTLSGKNGDDAKPYQEKDVKNVLKKLNEIQENQGQ